MIDFSKHTFAPVVHLPVDYEVYDFTAGYDPNRKKSSKFGIGKYNEVRKGMYTSELFAGDRNIHMGIDIATPVGEPVMSFFSGEIFLFGYNAAPGDYGATLITRHVFPEGELFALYGHLSKASLAEKKIGQKIAKGEVIAWVGDFFENGGWNPHLHFQLSFLQPTTFDMPGAVNAQNHQQALKDYPDPQLVLGKLY